MMMFIMAGALTIQAADQTESAIAFKKYCETNTWYFSKLTALPDTLPPGFNRVKPSSARQAFLTTPTGSRLIYAEYEMVNIKAIELKGNFTQVEGTAGIFRREDDYTRQYTNNIAVMAAFDSHLFLVDGCNYQRGTAQALIDATTLARWILENWGKKQ
jgi:hypothetical protein